MKILALEFSSRQRSVAVVLRNPRGTSSREPSSEPPTQPVAAGPHSNPGTPSLSPRTTSFETLETGAEAMQVFSMVERALAGAEVHRKEIECLAIGIGPGSYTGIRAAIAVAQGWQLAAGVKLIGISSVECLAAQAQAGGFAGRADIIVDAQRNEFYLAGYEISSEGYRLVSPMQITRPEEVAARKAERDALFGPDGPRRFPEAHELFPRADMLGRLALDRNDYVPGEKMEPIYLRETTFVKAPPPRLPAV